MAIALTSDFRPRSRWAVQADPDILVPTDEQPLHLLVSRCLEVSRKLLRASASFHHSLVRAGFARGQPLRRLESTMSETQLTDAFMLGMDDARLQGYLRMTIQEHGDLWSSVGLENAVDPDSFDRGNSIFWRGKALGKLDWGYAEIDGSGRFSRARVVEQFEVYANSSQLLPLEWKTALLDSLVP